MIKIYNRIFNRFTKWEYVKDGIREEWEENFFTGKETLNGRHYFKLYKRENKYTGLIHYKRVYL